MQVCVDAGAAAHGLAHRPLTGLKRGGRLSVSDRCIVSWMKALDNVAVWLEITRTSCADALTAMQTNTFVLQVAQRDDARDPSRQPAGSHGAAMALGLR
jgi:hypothetical protein